MPDPILDIQDRMHDGLAALEGLRDLLCDADCPGKTRFETLSRSGLAALVSLVEAPLREAGQMLDSHARTLRR